VEEGEGWRYQLLVQKQSGTLAIPARVVLMLPAGARIISASPELARVTDDTASFALSLATDQRIDVLFSTATPPD
jgi:hypothetical protein